MEDIIVFSVGAVICFILGVVFAKSVLSESAAIKQHVSDEVGKLRTDVGAALNKTAAKL